MVEVLLANETEENVTAMFEACRTRSHNITHLSVDYGVPYVDSADCVNVQESKPCDDVWLKAEYRERSWFGKAPTTTCRACPHPVGKGQNLAGRTGKVPQGTYMGCVAQYGCGAASNRATVPATKRVGNVPVTKQGWEECRDTCASAGYEYLGIGCQGYCTCYMPGRGTCVPEILSDYEPQIRCQSIWNNDYCNNQPWYITEEGYGKIYFGSSMTMASYCANPDGCELVGEGAPGDDGSTADCAPTFDSTMRTGCVPL